MNRGKKHYPAQKPCRHKGCRKWSVMMRTVKGKDEHYCGEHWRSDVESTPEWQKHLREWQKAIAAPKKPKRRKIKVKR